MVELGSSHLDALGSDTGSPTGSGPADGKPSWRRPFFLGVVLGCGLSIVGLVLATLVGLAVFGAMMETGHVPDTVAVPGEEIPAPALEFLLERGIVEKDERILYFYSDGVFTYEEDGNLFTDLRVISYWEDDEGTFLIETANYPEITTIDTEYGTGVFETTVITVETETGGTLTLLVSPDEDGDRKFHDLLVATWHEQR